MAENDTEETTVEAGQAETPAAESAPTSETDATSSTGSRRKIRVGTVTSDKSDKTVTVTVERQMAHPLYGKQVGRRKKVHAHDENNEYRIGDIVRITETRPLSKTKRWRVVELIERPE